MDPLSPLLPTRGYYTRNHPYFVVARGTVGLVTSSHFTRAKNIGPSYLSPLACSEGSTELSGNLSPPATYQLYPYHRILRSLRSRSNGTPLGHYGPVAHSRCPPHCTYYLGAYPPLLPHPIYLTETHDVPSRSPSRMAHTEQPPDLRNRGCLHQSILPPQGTCLGPYDRLSIAAAIRTSYRKGGQG